jgi:hypothetical protein
MSATIMPGSRSIQSYPGFKYILLLTLRFRLMKNWNRFCYAVLIDA